MCLGLIVSVDDPAFFHHERDAAEGASMFSGLSRPGGAVRRANPQDRHDSSTGTVPLRTVCHSSITYAHHVMSGDETDTAERLIRIERMIEIYRDRKRRQALQRAWTLMCKAETRRQLVELERSLTRGR